MSSANSESFTFSSSMKNTIGSLIGIALNLQIALGSILIFTLLILLIHEYGIFLHLVVSSLFSFISVLQFSIYRSFIEGNGTPLQYSCLENPMDRGAWQAVVRGVAKSRTRLNDFTFTFHLHALEKEMATHSRVLAQRIPETRKPGGLLSMGSHRVGHD